MASNWFLFIGIFLVCSGFGTVVGILMLVYYFWDDLGKKLKFSQCKANTYNYNNLNVDSGFGTGKDDLDTPMSHISKESREKMR